MTLTGCSPGDAPKSLLEVPQMVDVLTDFHLAEAALSKDNLSVKDREIKRHYFQDVILEEKGVDRTLFFDSYQYYLQHPALIDTIYSHIIDELNRLVPVEQERHYKRTELEKAKPKWQHEREARLNEQREAAKKR